MNAEMQDRAPSLPAKHDKRLECGQLLAMFTGAACARTYWHKVLLIGESDLFLDFYEPMEAICAVQRLQKPLFYLFLPTILAASPMDMCAKNSCIDSVGEIRGI